MKRANYVRNIKSAISSTFGKVFIGDIPGQKASMDEITNWKNSTNVMWTRNNLWSKVNESEKDDDTLLKMLLFLKLSSIVICKILEILKHFYYYFVINLIYTLKDLIKIIQNNCIIMLVIFL